MLGLAATKNQAHVVSCNAQTIHIWGGNQFDTAPWWVISNGQNKWLSTVLQRLWLMRRTIRSQRPGHGLGSNDEELWLIRSDKAKMVLIDHRLSFVYSIAGKITVELVLSSCESGLTRKPRGVHRTWNIFMEHDVLYVVRSYMDKTHRITVYDCIYTHITYI